MVQENSTETCVLSRVKQITSPGWKHETSAQTWCTGNSQRDRVEREVGGGIGMGNTCKPMAVSFQCMTKFTTKKKKKPCISTSIVWVQPQNPSQQRFCKAHDQLVRVVHPRCVFISVLGYALGSSRLVAQLLPSCPTLCDPMDRSPLGSSVHGIFLARILKWVAMPSSRGSS